MLAHVRNSNYLSMAIAISVNTEAQILRLATNCDILQNSVPKGQFEFSMYTKLSVVFNVDTIASAIDRFTAGEKEDIRVIIETRLPWAWITLCRTYKVICDRPHSLVRHHDPYHDEIANCCYHHHSGKEDAPQYLPPHREDEDVVLRYFLPTWMERDEMLVNYAN
jgi:hypothetical protein